MTSGAEKELVHVFGKKRYGAWLLEILPPGERELKKICVTAESLLEAVKLYPETMNATFIAEGEFVVGTVWADEDE